MDTQRTSSTDKAMTILLKKLEESKAKNPRHSQRAFAQRLGLSSGSLSELLSGKRSFSNSIKRKIADKLSLSPKETLDFFENDLPGTLKNSEEDRHTITQDQFHMISDWWYFAILNLVKTKNFKAQTGWIANRLGLSEKIIKEAWDRLFRLGYLEKKANGVSRKNPQIKTTDELMNVSVRKSHIEDLKLIESSLLHIDHNLRDNTSTTFVLNKEDIPKAKELIRIFHNQFTDLISKEKGTEVYKLSVSLYPLTKLSEKKQ